jgi:hypothetical protein
MAIPKDDGGYSGQGEKGFQGAGVNHELGDKATGTRETGSLKDRATGGEYSFFDKDLRGNPRVKESPWGLLDKNLDGSPKEKEAAFRLADKGSLEFSRPDFREVYNYKNEPYKNIRCQAKPGEIDFYLGNDPNTAIGITFKGNEALVEILSKMAELVLAKAFGPEISLMTEMEEFAYDQAMGKYTSAKTAELVKASGFELGPGRCFVHEPDRPETWWFRELK